VFIHVATACDERGFEVHQLNSGHTDGLYRIDAVFDGYMVTHVAAICGEHGIDVTKDSAEAIEPGWILLDAKCCSERDVYVL
jgi:hypothetical protein